MNHTLFAAILLLASSAQAATYYVSNSGNDGANGTTPLTPWQSINKANAVAGGSTVLFNRGDTFRGQIEVPATNITYGAYGVGPDPIISGSKPITGWSVHSGNIYVANVAFPVKHLFVNGALMTIARFPNSGWLYTDADEDETGFIDAALAARPGDAANYWNGATIRIRTYSWRLDIRKVQSYSANGAISFDTPLPEPVRGGWGYYLDGKLSELDTPGEWWYDAANGKVYLYARGGANPGSLLVEGMTTDFGVHIYYHKHSTTVENLSFRHQADDGININQSDNVTIRDCSFEYINDIGIQGSWNSVNNVYENNTFNHCLNRAITFNADDGWDAGNTRFTGNTITNTGMVPGYAATGQESVAIETWVGGITINNNRIEHTGYNGIQLEAPGVLVEGNVVEHSCEVLNDGGAIYVHSDGNIIRKNFFLSTIGGLDGSGTFNGKPLPSIGIGIYFHHYQGGSTIDSNVVAHNSHNGIYVDWGDNNTITNNILFDNRLHQMQIRAEDDSYVLHHTITGNVMFSLTREQVPLFLSGKTTFGAFEDNFYYNPYNEIVIVQAQANDLRPGPYTLGRWQRAHPTLDQDATTLAEHFPEYNISNPGANEVENPNFDTTVDPWHFWQSNISRDTKLDGGTLKVQFVQDEAQTWPTETPLIKDQYYAFDFSSIAQQDGAVRVLFYDETISPSWDILEERYFPLDTTRREQHWVFRAKRTTPESLPWFFVHNDVPVFWMDNVSVRPVDATPNDVSYKFKLVTNSTTSPAIVALGPLAHHTLSGGTILGSLLLPALSAQILTVDADAPTEVFLSADTNHNFVISLSELLRVVQLYNSGGFQCAASPGASEDGFVPGAGPAHLCGPHTSDYISANWAIGFDELLRTVQFYNAPGYRYCPGDSTEDGFCVALP